MIHIFIGTKAQFIKMAPVMVELDRRGLAYNYIDSGQHGAFTRSLRETFRIREPDVSLGKSGHDITTMGTAALWAMQLWTGSVYRKQWLREKVFPGGGICLVHGDTLSTLLGVRLARAAGVAVGHVEAGLRSRSLLHPFPEEIIRLYCMRRCNVLFAPSHEAVRNLAGMKVRGNVVHVEGNTVVDSLRLVENAKPSTDIPSIPYALAACHRFETITSRRRLEAVVGLLNRVSQEMRVLFVTHKPTRKRLERYGLVQRLSKCVVVLEMQDYVNFTTLMRNAKIVLADGGSIQEECAYFGKPCLILRDKTERSDGLGTTARVWGFDARVLEAFLADVSGLHDDSRNWPEPSKHIVSYLQGKYDPATPARNERPET